MFFLKFIFVIKIYFIFYVLKLITFNENCFLIAN